QASVSGQGDKFDAIVISPAFAGKNMVQQHQLVYGTLGNLMRDNVVHALSLRTYTPEQWASQTPLGLRQPDAWILSSSEAAGRCAARSVSTAPRTRYCPSWRPRCWPMTR